MIDPPLLATQDLACGYERRTVLAGARLTLAPGELVGVVGPNGAGKSTLLRVLAGLQPALAGLVKIAGRPIGAYDARALARLRAYVPQLLPPDEGWRVREVAAMGRFPYQRGWGIWEGAGDREAVERALAATRLTELADRPVSQLSGGQRQRAYLARALAQEAPLVMLDEPTAHLDLGHQIEFFRTLREVMTRRPMAAVAVLHDLNLAAQFCHRLWVVDAGDGESPGRVAADGRPEAVLTPGLVERVFGLAVQVRHHPETGVPYLLPLAETHQAVADGPRVHVVAGGGTGERLLPVLHHRGYRVSVGAVHLLDSDEALAARLGLEVVAEAPFSPLSAATLARLAAVLARAEAIVVADVAWGAGNVDNLRALAELPAAPPIWLVGDTAIARRDFTGGEATRLWQTLVGRGARVTPLSEVLAALPPRASDALS